MKEGKSSMLKLNSLLEHFLSLNTQDWSTYSVVWDHKNWEVKVRVVATIKLQEGNKKMLAELSTEFLELGELLLPDTHWDWIKD